LAVWLAKFGNFLTLLFKRSNGIQIWQRSDRNGQLCDVCIAPELSTQELLSLNQKSEYGLNGNYVSNLGYFIVMLG
jgi:hypothetical protein